jgi:hypothetical protein
MRKSSTIVYNFLIGEPFKVIHADIYSVGSEQAFDGEKGHLNVLDGLTGYAISEPLLANQMKAAGFSKAIMKILLAKGLAHTIVIDKDSKFHGIFFKETMQLLQIKTRDQISPIDWQILAKSKFKFDNEPPPLHHMNSQFHTIRQDASVTKRLHVMSMHNYLYKDS